MAADQAPKEPIGTVSEFAGWVYSLYAPPQSKATLHLAKSVEAPIFDKRPELWLDSFMVEAPSTKWHLTHNGLHTGNITGFSHFEIPTLSVGGEPLRASPDLVYRHSETKSTVIVEIKFSRRPIPSNLWPNVWAQLWAYSKIPSLTESPTLSVVGEIWGGENRWNSSALSDRLYLRKTVQQDPRRATFDRFFAALFAIYSGVETAHQTRGAMMPLKNYNPSD